MMLKRLVFSTPISNTPQLKTTLNNTFDNYVLFYLLDYLTYCFASSFCFRTCVKLRIHYIKLVIRALILTNLVLTLCCKMWLMVLVNSSTRFSLWWLVCCVIVRMCESVLNVSGSNLNTIYLDMWFTYLEIGIVKCFIIEIVFRCLFVTRN